MKPRDGNAFRRLMVPALLLHAVCCGALLLALLVGSAGLTALLAFARDPLTHAAGLLAGAALAIWAWRRRGGLMSQCARGQTRPAAPEPGDGSGGTRA